MFERWLATGVQQGGIGLGIQQAQHNAWVAGQVERGVSPVRPQIHVGAGIDKHVAIAFKPSLRSNMQSGLPLA